MDNRLIVVAPNDLNIASYLHTVVPIATLAAGTLAPRRAGIGVTRMVNLADDDRCAGAERGDDEKQCAEGSRNHHILQPGMRFQKSELRIGMIVS